MSERRPDQPQDSADDAGSIDDLLNDIPPEIFGDEEFGDGKATPHRIVRASAGAGKTYRLTTQYLAMIHADSPAEGILATTFTRKAAGEILNRVLLRLADAATSDKESKALAAAIDADGMSPAVWQTWLQQLCRALHRVNIGTIDSFFHRTALSFRHELGLPPQPRMIDEGSPEAANMRRDAIESVLADDEPAVLLDLLRRLHHDHATRSVYAAIDGIVVNLYSAYEEAPEASKWQLATPKRLTDKQVAALRQELEALVVAEAHGKRIDGALAKTLEALDQNDWDVLLKSGPTKSLATGDGLYYKKPLPEEVQAVLEPLAKNAIAEVVGQVATRTAAMHELMSRFDGMYQQLRERRNALFYSDIPIRLANFLADADDVRLADVYFRLDGRVTHLLLDEFQDTSLRQWSVLEPMAAEIVGWGDGSRTLFCVGDIKQAIYAWRGGCAEIFDHIETTLDLPMSAREQLNTSYRTSQPVLDAVNDVFANLGHNAGLTDSTDMQLAAFATVWSSRFQPHIAQHKKQPGYVELYVTPAPPEEDAADNDKASRDGDDATSNPGNEDAGPMPKGKRLLAAQAAAYIQRIAADAPGRSVGVLMRTNGAVSAMIEELRRLGVEATGESGRTVIDDPAVGAVLAAIQLADHPGDTVATFHVVNSPMGDVVGLTSAGPGDASRAAAHIRRRLIDEGYPVVIADWAKQLAPACSTVSAYRLWQLVEIADGFADQATLRPRDFIEVVEKTLVEDPTSARVRVMTVHKSKGLEFDVVALPELTSRLGVLREEIYVHRPSPTQPIDAVYAAADKETCKLHEELDEARLQQQHRRIQDDLCAFYVAMTRARYALHLIIPPLKPTKSGIGTAGNTDASAAAILRHQLGGELEDDFAGDRVLFTRGDADWERKQTAIEEAERRKHIAAATADDTQAKADSEVEDASRGIDSAEEDADEVDHTSPLVIPIAKGLAPTRMRWRTSPSRLAGADRQKPAELFNVDQQGGRQHGTLVHEWLSLIEWIDDAASWPSDDAVLQVGRPLSPESSDADLLSRWHACRKQVEAPAIAALLYRPRDEPGITLDVWRERSFAVQVGDELLTGAFDRVVLRRKAGRVIAAELIDYKTDRDKTPAELVEAYRPQIAGYCGALQRMFGLQSADVTARLALLRYGEAPLVD